MLPDCKLSRILLNVLQPSDRGKQSSSGFQSNSPTFIKGRTSVLHGEFAELSSNSVTCDCSKLKLMTANKVLHHFSLVPLYSLASCTYLQHLVINSVSCEIQIKRFCPWNELCCRPVLVSLISCSLSVGVFRSLPAFIFSTVQM